MKKLKENEFYCLPQKKVIEIESNMITFEFDRNGRPRLIAQCGENKLYKYIKFSDVEYLSQKYN